MIISLPLIPIFVATVILCVIFLAAVVLSVIFYVRFQKQQKRLAEMSAFAAANGWTFFPNNTLNVFQNANAYRIFNRGHSRRIRAFMQRQAANGEQFFVFDYQYTMSHGKSRRTHYQTVFAARSVSLNLPYFALYPEEFFSFVGEIFGYNDIDFAMHPTFSQRYKLSGQNEAHIRRVFQPQVLSRLEAAGNLNIDGGDNYLFVYWQSTPVKPVSLNGFIGEGMNILQFFRR